MRTMTFRKHFDYDVEQASDDAVVHNDMPSLTVQSQAEDADINVLMKRYGITGKLPENPRVPMYGDFTEVTDYRSALHAVMDAQERFMEFPADVRAKFDNDPQRLLEFAADGRNLDAARAMGLLKPEVQNGNGVTGFAGGSGADNKASAGNAAGNNTASGQSNAANKPAADSAAK